MDALDSVDELETDLDQSKESMYKLSYVIRVSAPDLDELKRRCDEVKDFYDDLNVKLVRPAGDMLGLHSEFLPASKRYINDYVQYVKSDFLAGLGFGATQQLGENTGIYIGYSVDTGRNVYLQPSCQSRCERDSYQRFSVCLCGKSWRWEVILQQFDCLLFRSLWRAGGHSRP